MLYYALMCILLYTTDACPCTRLTNLTICHAYNILHPNKLRVRTPVNLSGWMLYVVNGWRSPDPKSFVYFVYACILLLGPAVRLLATSNNFTSTGFNFLCSIDVYIRRGFAAPSEKSNSYLHVRIACAGCSARKNNKE